MIQKICSRALAMCLVLSFGSLGPALGQDMMTLQVTAGSSNAVSTDLSIENLDALDQVEFETSTIWTDGISTYSGVSLKALLNHLGITGNTIQMVALNDYAVAIPFADLNDDAPIVATRMDGKLMSVRDKGPYWVVYPYDLDLKYQNETAYSRSIWQLNRLKVID
ncbi:MAG: oxidoreductase [Pseudoruegeria sp.]